LRINLQEAEGFLLGTLSRQFNATKKDRGLSKKQRYLRYSVETRIKKPWLLIKSKEAILSNNIGVFPVDHMIF
jgi:hypothetical protein